MAKAVAALGVVAVTGVLAHKYSCCRLRVRDRSHRVLVLFRIMSSRILVLQMFDQGPKGRALTAIEASARVLFIRNVRYGLDLELSKGSPEYHGHCTVSFDGNMTAFTKAAAIGDSTPYFLDFTGKRINNINVNGRDTTAQAHAEAWWKGEKISLPSEFLREGPNVIIIDYHNEYGPSSHGFFFFFSFAFFI